MLTVILLDRIPSLPWNFYDYFELSSGTPTDKDRRMTHSIVAERLSTRDERLSPRTAISLPAHVYGFVGSRAARILTLSSYGAKVKTRAPLQIGAQLVLAWDAVERPAEVKWKLGRLFGLRFTAGPDYPGIAIPLG